MIDPKLIRWINASINKAFDTGRGSYVLHVEGQERNFGTATSWAELHVSVGPDIDETTKGSFDVEITLTIMCSATYNDDDYLIHKITGQFLTIMSSPISVFKYGIGDDSSFIGCFQPLEAAKVIAWGQVQTSTQEGSLRVKQQSVEQSFRMSF